MNYKLSMQAPIVNSDDWDNDLIYLEQIYGENIVNKINNLIDEGMIEEVNLIIKYLK